MRRALSQEDSISPEHLATRDALFDGSLLLSQPATGYRVNVDTLLLAETVIRNRPGRIKRLVDLGAGVGGLALCVHRSASVGRIDLVERDAAQAALAEHNLRENGATGQVHSFELSTDGPPPSLMGIADVVVCNPPFFEAVQTRPRRIEAQQAARSGPVQPFLTAASRCLGRRGAAFFVYPAQSLPAFLSAAAAEHLHAKRLRFVHAYADRPARIALVELRRAKPGGLVVDPPLVEWEAPGIETSEFTAIRGRPAVDRR